MASISSSNSIIMLGIKSLFGVPQQLQGYSTDDIFSVEAVDSKELRLGVDGKLSAGYIPTMKKMMVMFQADSPSIDLFEAWHTAEEASKDTYFAFGLVQLPSVGKVYTLINGVLTSYSPMPDAKKVLEPRKFGITWESIIPAPI